MLLRPSDRNKTVLEADNESRLCSTLAACVVYSCFLNSILSFMWHGPLWDRLLPFPLPHTTHNHGTHCCKKETTSRGYNSSPSNRSRAVTVWKVWKTQTHVLFKSSWHSSHMSSLILHPPTPNCNSYLLAQCLALHRGQIDSGAGVRPTVRASAWLNNTRCWPDGSPLKSQVSFAERARTRSSSGAWWNLQSEQSGVLQNGRAVRPICNMTQQSHWSTHWINIECKQDVGLLENTYRTLLWWE